MSSFELQITFTGLCMHVIEPGDQPTRSVVLLPDGRYTRDPKEPFEPDKHVDGTPAVPHVGYLRVNLASVLGADGQPAFVTDEPDDKDGDPRFEVIYRLDRQVIDFGLPGPDGEPVNTMDIALPKLNDVIPTVDLIDDLFKPKPPKELLARTKTLYGGTYRSVPGKDQWHIRSLDPACPHGIRGKFAGDVTWTKTDVPGGTLTISFYKFGKADGNSLTLQPLPEKDSTGKTKLVVKLKIANLCAENPLEWNQFPLRLVGGEDSDFKWNYKLTVPAKGSTWPDELRRRKQPLPAPHFVWPQPDDDGSPFTDTGVDCIRPQLIAGFPDA